MKRMIIGLVCLIGVTSFGEVITTHITNDTAVITIVIDTIANTTNLTVSALDIIPRVTIPRSVVTAVEVPRSEVQITFDGIYATREKALLRYLGFDPETFNPGSLNLVDQYRAMSKLKRKYGRMNKETRVGRRYGEAFKEAIESEDFNAALSVAVLIDDELRSLGFTIPY